MISYSSVEWIPDLFVSYAKGKLHRHTLESARGHVDVWRDARKRRWAYEVAYDGVRLPARYAKSEDDAKAYGLVWADRVMKEKRL